MSFEPTEEILAVARSLPQGLCDHCLGRRFARVQQATNSERGRAIRLALAAAGARSEPAVFCPICDNIFDELDGIARAAARKMAPYEFSTFLVGSKQEASTLELEERLGYPEHLKQEVNRELGKRLEALTGKTVDFDSPDVTIIVDIAFGSVEIQLAPLFIYGRYRKLERGIPQTRWPCRACRGKGCARCGGTGRMYQTSVEELIAGAVMRAA
ncbi:MAG: tRNA pseudouridine(54/55) synthase Pus10, partial [Thermoplasmata archaeon]